MSWHTRTPEVFTDLMSTRTNGRLLNVILLTSNTSLVGEKMYFGVPELWCSANSQIQ